MTRRRPPERAKSQGHSLSCSAMAEVVLPDLSLTEWAVLALAAEQATHGFAIAKALAPDGDLGRIWTVSRPLVYYTLGALERHDLLEPLGSEPGERGPARTRIRATRSGLSAIPARPG